MRMAGVTWSNNVPPSQKPPSQPSPACLPSKPRPSTSIEDAIDNALAECAKTLHNMDWFEVTETRGHIENGKVGHYQVTLKVGFRITGS